MDYLQVIHFHRILQYKSSIFQWPLQVLKFEVPTLCKAYFSGLCKGISAQNVAWKMVTVALFQDPGIPMEYILKVQLYNYK